MKSAAYIISGLAAGIFSGAMGIGGAIVATPLIRFAGISPYLAIGTTMPAILPATITGAWTYLRARLVDARAAAFIGLAGGSFSFVGARATRAVDGHLLMLLTAFVLLAVAIRLPDRGPREKEEMQEAEAPAATSTDRRGIWRYLLIGAFAGFFSGLLGIGGGFVVVPALIRLFSFPIKKALGTSLAVIALMALPNIAGQSQAGNIEWQVAIFLALGMVPGARLGAALAIRSSDKKLRLVVSAALGAIALIYALSEVAALSSG